MAEEWLVLVGALAAGFALGALTLFAANLLRRRPRPAPEPELVRLEPVEDDVPFQDHFGVAHAPRAPAPAPMPRAPLRAEPEPSSVPTEWAARAPDGTTLPPGHTRGVCSGCGTPLSVGPHRPLRIACPECGRTRLLA